MAQEPRVERECWGGQVINRAEGGPFDARDMAESKVTFVGKGGTGCELETLRIPCNPEAPQVFTSLEHTPFSLPRRCGRVRHTLWEEEILTPAHSLPIPGGAGQFDTFSNCRRSCRSFAKGVSKAGESSVG